MLPWCDGSFRGRSELEYAHAALIVLMRLGMEVSHSWRRFCELWSDSGSFLLQHLNSRWLVSACDTIADHDRDRAQRALALAASALVNTVRLYETERWMGPSPVRVPRENRPLAPHSLMGSCFSWWGREIWCEISRQDCMRSARAGLQHTASSPNCSPPS
jgi:hypothetical protein